MFKIIQQKVDKSRFISYILYGNINEPKKVNYPMGWNQGVFRSLLQQGGGNQVIFPGFPRIQFSLGSFPVGILQAEGYPAILHQPGF